MWRVAPRRAFSSQRRSVPLSRFENEAKTDAVSLFASMRRKIDAVRSALGRPLTLTEKLLGAHMIDPMQPLRRGESYLKLQPVRVAMQDASAQMAVLQFMSTGLGKTAVPSTIHCDHLIQAETGEAEDLGKAQEDSGEIFDFLQTASKKYGVGFWRPGSGIIHQVVLENYAFPGGLMIGTDSHTPNAGGLGMFAVGVGGVDAAEVMAGLPWELKAPGVIGVHLHGSLDGWASPKDVILQLAGHLTVKGGTGHVIEYFGDGVRTLSCTGMATICNMGAEVGATTSVFPWTAAMAEYLSATSRGTLADVCSDNRDLLVADPDVGKGDYDRIVDIDLDSIRPRVNGPFTPDLSHDIEHLGRVVKEHNWPSKVHVGLIGSCTNSSYEDMTRAASVVRAAASKGLSFKSKFTVTPGSEQIRATMARDGLIDVFESAGATVLANACGPCIGQWKRSDITAGEENSIIASFNRNFNSRNDGNAATHNFLASPEVVVALSLAGTLCFDPARDTIDGVKLEPPRGSALPVDGFACGRPEFMEVEANAADPAQSVAISATSSRLQLLEPFCPWTGEDFVRAPVLVKAVGKCTTDHISAAGPWLKYKGHLENLSENTLIGAVNADTGETNRVLNQLTGSYDSIPEVAKAYRSAGVPWVIVGDSNYGEGSAREHAAMQPRYLGGCAVIARSLARIHETNLKKQGMLPLVFADASDYDAIDGKDQLSIVNLHELSPGSVVQVLVHKPGIATPRPITCLHTFSEEQLQWFRAGSALNAASQK